MDLEDELRAIVRKKLPAGTMIEAQTRLADAGLDSLDVAEIAFDIEDKFRIQLPPLAGQVSEVTFAELCRIVAEKLTATAAETEGGGSVRPTASRKAPAQRGMID